MDPYVALFMSLTEEEICQVLKNAGIPRPEPLAKQIASVEEMKADAVLTDFPGVGPKSAEKIGKSLPRDEAEFRVLEIEERENERQRVLDTLNSQLDLAIQTKDLDTLNQIVSESGHKLGTTPGKFLLARDELQQKYDRVKFVQEAIEVLDGLISTLDLDAAGKLIEATRGRANSLEKSDEEFCFEIYGERWKELIISFDQAVKERDAAESRRVYEERKAKRDAEKSERRAKNEERLAIYWNKSPGNDSELAECVALIERFTPMTVQELTLAIIDDGKATDFEDLLSKVSECKWRDGWGRKFDSLVAELYGRDVAAVETARLRFGLVKKLSYSLQLHDVRPKLRAPKKVEEKVEVHPVLLALQQIVETLNLMIQR